MEKNFKNLELVYKKKCDNEYKNPGPEEHSTGEYSIELVFQKIS